MRRFGKALLLAVGASAAFFGCGDPGGSGGGTSSATESCMTCHNGSQQNDYKGPGLENPHPYGTGFAANMTCTFCHGGNPGGETPLAAHVPPPPQIGDDTQLENDEFAYFNRLTLTGLDKLPDYTVGGVTYTALDYLQFINPGDLRVVTQNRSCGQCHDPHVDTVNGSLLATEAGILSGAMYAIGVDNALGVTLYEDTAADKGFRAVTDPNYFVDPTNTGAVGELIEYPVYSVFNEPGSIHANDNYLSPDLDDDQLQDGRVITGSPLADLYHEQVAFTCGDCHLGSAGANNRYGDFRSSGCTSCHMRYSLDGRSTSGDPNVDPFEPADPDQIEEPELPHIKRHLLTSIAKTLPSGEFVQGIDDYTCAGCHQGSNRTVMQYWGIRLDQNQDVRNDRQYPDNPASFKTTSGDTRLFDPVVGNNTFNGRNRNQYLLEEDYDGDGLDDTPPDVHYEAGMGCIDCHGSYDLHGGDTSLPGQNEIKSRMEHSVAIKCVDCHGTVAAYAPVAPGVGYDGVVKDLAMDSEGNQLKHVFRDAQGDYYMVSRLTGNTHYVSQTRDVTVDTGKVDPFTSQPVYSAKASYAMGTADGSPATGIGPQQETYAVTPGFSHMDNLSCEACHSSWTNSCIGCHLEGEYNTGDNYSNITGERIVFREREADFVYQTPVHFQLGVGPDNKIRPIVPNTDMFFTYEDKNNVDSKTFAFSDRNANGANPFTEDPSSLAHNVIMQHSIRGKVDSSYEGPRYCVACHLTDDGLAQYGGQYTAFKTRMQNDAYDLLNYNMLKQHIGRNTGNDMNSPMFVHMAAGLGTGLFNFDEDGCPENPLDTFAGRKGCDGVAPATSFDAATVKYNLDAIVDVDGTSNGSNNHPMDEPPTGTLRDFSDDPNMAGPLGKTLIEKLTDPATGIVLDSYLDADATADPGAQSFIDGGGP